MEVSSAMNEQDTKRKRLKRLLNRFVMCYAWRWGFWVRFYKGYGFWIAIDDGSPLLFSERCKYRKVWQVTGLRIKLLGKHF